MAYRRLCVLVERATGFCAAFAPRRAGADFAFAAIGGFRRDAAAAGGRRGAGAERVRDAAGRAAGAFAVLGAALGSSAGPVRCTSVNRI